MQDSQVVGQVPEVWVATVDGGSPCDEITSMHNVLRRQSPQCSLIFQKHM